MVLKVIANFELDRRQKVLASIKMEEETKARLLTQPLGHKYLLSGRLDEAAKISFEQGRIRRELRFEYPTKASQSVNAQSFVTVTSSTVGGPAQRGRGRQCRGRGRGRANSGQQTYRPPATETQQSAPRSRGQRQSFPSRKRGGGRGSTQP